VLPQLLQQPVLWPQGHPSLCSVVPMSHLQMDLFNNLLGWQPRHYPSCQLFSPCCRLLEHLWLLYHPHNKTRAQGSPVAVRRGHHHCKFRWEFMSSVVNCAS
jgi:hypothetical protein